MIRRSDRFPLVPTSSRNQSNRHQFRLVPTGSGTPPKGGAVGTSHGTSRWGADATTQGRRTR